MTGIHTGIVGQLLERFKRVEQCLHISARQVGTSDAFLKECVAAEEYGFVGKVIAYAVFLMSGCTQNGYGSLPTLNSEWSGCREDDSVDVISPFDEFLSTDMVGVSVRDE